MAPVVAVVQHYDEEPEICATSLLATATPPTSPVVTPAFVARKDGPPPGWDVAWRVQVPSGPEDEALLEAAEESARRAELLGMPRQRIKRMLSGRDDRAVQRQALSLLAFSHVQDVPACINMEPPSPRTALSGDALRHAATAGDVEALRRLVGGADGPSANRYVNSSNTILMLAAMHGHTDCVQLLLSCGAAVDLCVRDRSISTCGWTAFHFAADRGHLDCATALLHAGCSWIMPPPSHDTREPRLPEAVKDEIRECIAAQKLCRALQRLAFGTSALGCGNVLFLLAPDLLAECCSQLRLESHHCRVPFAREAIRIRSEPHESCDAGADDTAAPATAVNLLRRSTSA